MKKTRMSAGSPEDEEVELAGEGGMMMRGEGRAERPPRGRPRPRPRMVVTPAG